MTLISVDNLLGCKKNLPIKDVGTRKLTVQWGVLIKSSTVKGYILSGSNKHVNFLFWRDELFEIT